MTQLKTLGYHNWEYPPDTYASQFESGNYHINPQAFGNPVRDQTYLANV